MPFSVGVPLGLVILTCGTFLLLTTKYKTTAKLIIGIGAGITVFTLIIIFLAASSQM